MPPCLVAEAPCMDQSNAGLVSHSPFELKHACNMAVILGRARLPPQIPDHAYRYLFFASLSFGQQPASLLTPPVRHYIF